MTVTTPKLRVAAKVGTRVYVDDVVAEYERLAAEDDSGARILADAGQFRPSLYLVIQGMEKRVRAAWLRLGVEPPEEFSRRVKSHSLKEALDDLIGALARDRLAREHVESQLYGRVLEWIGFGRLHNELRYPSFVSPRDGFTSLRVGRSDVDAMMERSRRLQGYLRDVGRLATASG